MQALLYYDLGKNTVSDSLGGQPFTWGKWTQGEDVTISLRLAQRVDNQSVEVSRVLRSLKATYGKQDARPEGGAFRLKIGNDAGVQGVNVTGEIPHNPDAATLAAALNGLSGKPSVVRCGYQDGSLLVVCDNGVDLNLAVFENNLWPVSFVRIRKSNATGAWVHELRLIQAPVASTSTAARIVPRAPYVARVQAGGESLPSRWNEIQKLVVPPQFRGTFQVRRGAAKSVMFSVGADADEIQEGVDALGNESGDLVVTNPSSGVVHIEFSGSMAGATYDLLEVEIFDAPEGDITFTMPLKSWELTRLLARNGKEKLPFEIELVLEDEHDAETLRRYKFRADVEVVAEVAWDALSVPQAIEWLRPPAPRDYVPFTADQIITGSQHYVTTFGDGVLTEYTFDHNLGTEALHVTIRQNAVDAMVLLPGTDYILTIHDENSLTVALTGEAPGVADLAIVITSAGPISAFQAHTHTIAQIVDLQAILDDYGSRIIELEESVPTGALTVPVVPVNTVTSQWLLPSRWEILPVHRQWMTDLSRPLDLASVDLSAYPNFPRYGGLFPAVHDAAAEALTLPLPTVPNDALKGKVYQNQSGSVVEIGGGGGHRSFQLQPSEHVACVSAGERLSWYRVAKIGSEKTWYPSDFDRELFMFAVDEKQLQLKRLLTLNMGVELRVLESNTVVHCVLVIEHGAFTADTEPATTGPNLAAITWHATPILTQRIIITPVSCVHALGCRIERSASNAITTAALQYGGAVGGGSAPAGANFALRARLVRWDTENAQADPRGFVAVLGLAQSLNAEESVGKATIITA